jgi:hypothetical protein
MNPSCEATEPDPCRVTGGHTFSGGRRVLVSAGIALVGFLLLALGLGIDPRRTWLSYLMAFAYLFTISVGGLIFLLIAYATGARWMSVVRRVTEVVALPIPVLILLFIPLLFGLDQLYPWRTPPAHASAHELEILAHRQPFMNPVFFAIRAAIYLAVFAITASLLRRWSLARDREPPGAEVLARSAALSRERKFASAMLPPVGLALTFAAIDWIMSLQPIWYSTIFGIYIFAGGFVSAIALVTLLTERIWTLERGTGVVTPHHFHALGRLLFAFVVFWAYSAYFQVHLIGMADLPEEVTFYLERFEGAWWVLVWILILGHFALPFLFLLRRPVKFRPRLMAAAGWWILVMHLVDVYWIVIPSQVQGQMVFHWLDLAALAAVLGTALAVAAWRQSGVRVIAERDPLLPEGALYRSKT